MNKTLWIVVIVLLAIGGYYWLKSGGSLSSSYTMTQSSASPTPSVKSTGSAKTGTGGSAATPVGVTKTYTQITAEYSNRTIQFNDMCQASPMSFVLKNNTSILLDNRSTKTHTVTVNGQAYLLGAYGYRTINLSSSVLPKLISINCDTSVNVSTVNLEANISGQ